MMFAVLVAKTYEKPINSGKDLLDRGVLLLDLHFYCAYFAQAWTPIFVKVAPMRPTFRPVRPLRSKAYSTCHSLLRGETPALRPLTY